MKKNFLFLLLCVVLSIGAAYLVSDRLIDKRMSDVEFYNSISGNTGKDDNKSAGVLRASSSKMVDFSDAAEMAVQTVVYVKVVKRAQISHGTSVLDLLFGFANTPKDQVGLGSGVIIRSDGYIVTNNHVVNGADEIEVTLDNNKVYKATLVGTDRATDIALLKIDADNLPSIPLGDSDRLRLGEWVLAIGSPYDLRSTITAGIVSAKGRSFPNYDGQFKVESFIQTDAAVNPGNSGGALVNGAGELVGINTSIISLTGSYTGYSFAVPVNIVKKITDDLIEFGEVKRAVLGITMQDINDDVAKQLGLQSVEGVYINDVQRGGVADKAGIRRGDILTEINLVKVKNGAAVQEQMSKLRPGEQAAITIKRKNEQKEIIVQL
ncbi:MAG: trypsin-like peptidase domain-containing protein [Bacteroidales bacterium]|nr:trypsin-like peptidase domain-containing protein [Bacteroidales bacterium]MDD4671019.1 trypsin-like peptidase domain-containing protein [Bacteroidales bacterium]